MYGTTTPVRICVVLVMTLNRQNIAQRWFIWKRRAQFGLKCYNVAQPFRLLQRFWCFRPDHALSTLSVISHTILEYEALPITAHHNQC